MSKTGVIVALVVALLLAAAVYFFGGKGGAAGPSGPLLAFDPARVIELRVTRPDGRYESVRRGVQPGLWDIVLGGKGREQVWPADSGRMRAALRILSTLESDQETDRKASVEGGAPEVRLTLDDQSTRSMRVSARTLAGKVLIEVAGMPGSSGSRAAWVGADVGAMLVGTGPREWRDRAALPGLGPDVSRITLKGERGTIALARVQGRWGLRQPVQEAAEPEAVSKLLGVLSNILVMDFLDTGPPEHTELDKPIAELTIETDQRNETGKIQTASRTLRVGQQADIGGKTVFAGLATSADRDIRIVTVSADGLSGLTTDPSAYVSRRSVQIAAADVGGVVITPTGGLGRRYQRELEGWMALGQGGEMTPCPKSDTDAIAALLNLLTQLPADAAIVSEAWPAFWGAQPGVQIAAVALTSAGGTPVASVGVLMATLPANPKTPMLVVPSGGIWRSYAVDASSPLVVWLGRGP